MVPERARFVVTFLALDFHRTTRWQSYPRIMMTLIRRSESILNAPKLVQCSFLRCRSLRRSPKRSARAAEALLLRYAAQTRTHRAVSSGSVTVTLFIAQEQENTKPVSVAGYHGPRQTLATNLPRHADEEEAELFPAILEGKTAHDLSG